MASESRREELLYLQVHGLRAQPPEALNEAMERAISTMRRGLYSESAGELTAAEADVLRSGGAVLEEQPGPDPMAEAAAEFAALLSISLTTGAAAKRLKVNVSRIRQMLGDRALYGVLVDGRWCIPEFQFHKAGRIPNIAKVNAALDPELHPVAVYRWYTLPEADLESKDGQFISPLAWLKAGYPVEPVVDAARDL